jgi:hypothetical protein
MYQAVLVAAQPVEVVVVVQPAYSGQAAMAAMDHLAEVVQAVAVAQKLVIT